MLCTFIIWENACLRSEINISCATELFLEWCLTIVLLWILMPLWMLFNILDSVHNCCHYLLVFFFFLNEALDSRRHIHFYRQTCWSSDHRLLDVLFIIDCNKLRILSLHLDGVQLIKHPMSFTVARHKFIVHDAEIILFSLLQQSARETFVIKYFQVIKWLRNFSTENLSRVVWQERKHEFKGANEAHDKHFPPPRFPSFFI